MAQSQRLEKTVKGTDLSLAGEAVSLDRSGALWLPEHRTLVVSDLHLGKGSAYAARSGQFLPPYDTRGRRWRNCTRRCSGSTRPASRALGDSFHDAAAPSGWSRRPRPGRRPAGGPRLGLESPATTMPRVSEAVGGRYCETVSVGGLTLRHEPLAGAPAGEIAGHLPPCGKVSMRGRSVRRRCFVSDGHGLVMPAFGAYAGGSTCGRHRFRAAIPEGLHRLPAGRWGVFAIGKSMLGGGDSQASAGSFGPGMSSRRAIRSRKTVRNRLLEDGIVEGAQLMADALLGLIVQPTARRSGPVAGKVAGRLVLVHPSSIPLAPQ